MCAVYRIVTSLKEIGQSQGCYKVILDCTPEKSQFYLSCGFQPKERQMAWYIDASTPSASIGSDLKPTPERSEQ